MITKPVEQAGFIYIYLSNESNTSHDVYFDDLRITHTKSKVLQEDHYYPFGANISALSSTAPLSEPNKFKFGGKEQEGYFNVDWTDFGARMYDAKLGRWHVIDPAAEEYDLISPYAFTANNPIKYAELDGRRFYFSAGAGHDEGNTGYIPRMLNIFEANGISNTMDINSHGGKFGDLRFTLGTYRQQPYYSSIPIIAGGPEVYFAEPDEPDQRITSAVNQIKSDIENNPLKEGEQFNLSGYSTGSVIMAQAALMLANEGHTIDNLVLIGSPITKGSKLYEELQGNENIKNIIRVDIDDDDVQTITPLTLGRFLLMGDDHPHFKYAFHENAAQYILELAQYLSENGVK